MQSYEISKKKIISVPLYTTRDGGMGSLPLPARAWRGGGSGIAVSKALRSSPTLHVGWCGLEGLRAPRSSCQMEPNGVGSLIATAPLRD